MGKASNYRGDYLCYAESTKKKKYLKKKKEFVW